MHLQNFFGGIALLRTRCILRRVRESKDKIPARPLFVNHEYGEWRVNLADFVAMASYFPPENLPVRLAPTARSRHP